MRLVALIVARFALECDTRGMGVGEWDWTCEVAVIGVSRTSRCSLHFLAVPVITSTPFTEQYHHLPFNGELGETLALADHRSCHYAAKG